MPEPHPKCTQCGTPIILDRKFVKKDMDLPDLITALSNIVRRLPSGEPRRMIRTVMYKIKKDYAKRIKLEKHNKP